MSNIFTKLDVPSRTAATSYAYDTGCSGPLTGKHPRRGRQQARDAPRCGRRRGARKLLLHGKRPQRHDVHTLVIGGGQAGLATSYWLSARRHRAPGARTPAPSSAVAGTTAGTASTWSRRTTRCCLPGMPYAGPDPGRVHAARPGDRLRAGLRRLLSARPCGSARGVDRLTASQRPLRGAQRTATTFTARQRRARHRPYQRPKIPPAARRCSRLTSSSSTRNDYRRPGQLADGGVLVVGTGQSGAQIAEELHARRTRRAPGRFDVPQRPAPLPRPRLIWWLMQSFLHGDEVGVHFPTVADLPTPAARFACNPHLSGKDGGHDINLRQFARQGMHLYGRLESIDGGDVAHFSDDLAERLRFADTQVRRGVPAAVRRLHRRGGHRRARRRSPAARRLHAADRHRARPRPRRHPQRDLGDRLPARLQLGRSARVRRVGLPETRRAA